MSFRIQTLRDNTNEGGHTDPISIAVAAASIFGSLKSIFGGGESAGGYDSTGRFNPGDINNRLNFLSQRIASNGLTIGDIDKNLVDSFIYSPSGWQGNIDNYIAQVVADKRANPQKYPLTPATTTAPILTPTASPSLGSFNISSLLLVGAGVFLVAQILGSKKRR